MTEEQTYRYEERLGILCGDAKPTPEQVAIARNEALAWSDDDFEAELAQSLERIKIKARERRREYATKKNPVQYRPASNDP